MTPPAAPRPKTRRSLLAEVPVEHGVALLRERLYGAISCLATLAVLARYTSDDTSAWTRVIDVAVATGGLWAASLMAHWVAHLGAQRHTPRGRAALEIVQSSSQILRASILPILALAAAGFGWLNVRVAMWTAMWFCVVELGLITLFSVRRTALRWWQKAIAVSALVFLGALVVGIKMLGH